MYCLQTRCSLRDGCLPVSGQFLMSCSVQSMANRHRRLQSSHRCQMQARLRLIAADCSFRSRQEGSGACHWQVGILTACLPEGHQAQQATNNRRLDVTCTKAEQALCESANHQDSKQRTCCVSPKRMPGLILSTYHVSGGWMLASEPRLHICCIPQ